MHLYKHKYTATLQNPCINISNALKLNICIKFIDYRAIIPLGDKASSAHRSSATRTTTPPAHHRAARTLPT